MTQRTIFLCCFSDYDCCYHARAFDTRKAALEYANSEEAKEKWGRGMPLDVLEVDYEDGNQS